MKPATEERKDGIADHHTPCHIDQWRALFGDRSGRGPSSFESRGREVKSVWTFSDLRELFSLLRRREEGQTMAEYGIVLAVITIAAVGVFTALSGGIQGAVSRVTNLLP
jgi:Flp pilus assembly pilin Flp